MADPAWIARFEALSRERPDRVLRLRGCVRIDAEEAPELFEVLIFRGFSSSTTHPTAFDPDQPVLGPALAIESAELLVGPLNPAAEQVLAGPMEPEPFLDPAAWL
jgi:hypothetical protein